MRVSAKQGWDAFSVKRVQSKKMRCPSPARNMHDIRFPRHHLIDEGWIFQTEEVVSSRIFRNVLYKLILIALPQGNIPSHGPLEPSVVNWRFTCMPGKKYLNR